MNDVGGRIVRGHDVGGRHAGETGIGLLETALVDLHAECPLHGLDGHARGALLALQRVSGDVERRVQGGVENRAVHAGLPFPGVDDGAEPSARHLGAQCLEIHHRSAGGVDQNSAVAHQRELALPDQMARGVRPGERQRRVERHGVALGKQTVERRVFAGHSGFLTRRVGHEHAASQRLSPLAHHRADVAHPYAPAGAPAEVNLIHADGGRGDQTHRRAFEQRGVAARARANHDGDGVAHQTGREPELVDISHLGAPGAHGLQAPAQKGYVFVCYYLHPSIIIR